MKNEVKYNKKDRMVESASSIIKMVQNKLHNDRISKDTVLHHLKQLKAQMGKYKAQCRGSVDCATINNCMEMIDKKIAKINKI